MAQQPIELILFRQLATLLAVPVFLVDDQGDLVYLNEPAEALLGIRLDELDHMPFETWTEAFRPRTPDGAVEQIEALPLVRAVTDRKPAHGPLLITGRDGREHAIEVTAFPLEGGRGRILGAVAMFWERTEP
jgi:PAS domain S-box-containing protein